MKTPFGPLRLHSAWLCSALLLVGGFVRPAIAQTGESGEIIAGSEQSTASEASSTAASSPHMARNPVFQWLLDGDSPQVFGSTIRLAAPTMPDGLTADQQSQILETIAKPRYSAERLLADSIAAPHILKIEHDPMEDDRDAPVLNRMTLYFTVSADLQSVSDPDFLQRVFELGDEAEDVSQIAAEKLQAAGITPPADDAPEAYAPIDTRIFDRIQLSGVGHSLWSKTDESILLALHVDQRFKDDPVLSAHWQRFERRDDGSMQPVEAGVFPGAGVYIKITTLKGHAGKLFVEAHGVLLEPYSWFRGRSLIVSKLPPAVRSEIQDLRRRAMRAERNSR